MADEALQARMTGALPRLGGLGARVKFDLGEDGQWLVDAREPVARLVPDDGEADCTIRVSGETMGKLLDGSLDPMLAYATGRLKVSGAVGVAMKLASVLG